MKSKIAFLWHFLFSYRLLSASPSLLRCLLVVVVVWMNEPPPIDTFVLKSCSFIALSKTRTHTNACIHTHTHACVCMFEFDFVIAFCLPRVIGFTVSYPHFKVRLPVSWPTLSITCIFLEIQSKAIKKIVRKSANVKILILTHRYTT